jgi:hypothetical protein
MQEEALKMDSSFRREPDAYETVLHTWTAFTQSACGGRIAPNRMESGRDAALVLVHRVPRRKGPIRCSNGECVRLVKLVFGKKLEMARH